MKKVYIISLTNKDKIYVEFTLEELEDFCNRCKCQSTIVLIDWGNKFHCVIVKHINQITEQP